MNKTQDDVKSFLYRNQAVTPIEKYWLWMVENGAVKIQNGEVFIIPDKQSSLEEVENGVTFVRHNFFRDLWTTYCSTQAIKEFRSQSAENARLKQLDEIASQKNVNTPEFQEVKRKMDDRFNDTVQGALGRS